MNWKNVFGFLGYLLIYFTPWIIFISGLWVENLYYIVSGGFFIVFNKLRSMKDLLSSISTALVVLLSAKKELEEEEKSEFDKDMFR